MQANQTINNIQNTSTKDFLTNNTSPGLPTSPRLRGTSLVTSIEINGVKVIPSDTFKIKDDKYILMDILQDPKTQIITLEIMGMKGVNMAKTAKITLADFENVTVESFNKIFIDNEE